MKIRMVSLKDITPYADNPRQNDAGVDAVAASIREFGFRRRRFFFDGIAWGNIPTLGVDGRAFGKKADCDGDGGNCSE